MKIKVKYRFWNIEIMIEAGKLAQIDDKNEMLELDRSQVRIYARNTGERILYSG